jgi:hypothetical protein
VFALRALTGTSLIGAEHSLPAAAAVFGVYLLGTGLATWALERRLLVEAVGYLVQRRRPAAAVAGAA